MPGLMDFSFNNSQIFDFFKGSDTYVPTSEFLYLHSHPLIKPNFLDQIEAMINKATIKVKSRNINGVLVNQLVQMTKDLGVELSSVTEENAAQILVILRKVYSTCAVIDKL